MPVTTPGSASGSVTTKKRARPPAPSVRAACSSFGSMASIDRRMARTMSGKPITAQAITAPIHVKTTVMPNQV